MDARTEVFPGSPDQDCLISGDDSRAWCRQAIDRIMADINRSADTHLLKVETPALGDIDLYVKDESIHPTGSLKHRLARSLFLYGLCNGWIKAGKPVIEASSGSTAVSEAYFAKLIGLTFIAVMPRGTSRKKIDAIESYGGRCHLVDDPTAIAQVSRKLAEETGGHFVDQFTYAERATDWRGNNNIAESIFSQLTRERFPIPAWIVMSAGTGGTSTTIGRFIRYNKAETRLCVVDPENSVFYDCFKEQRCDLTLNTGSRIEGIGRPRCELSFLPAVVDRMEKVPDAASLGAMHALAEHLGKRPGGSTGTNIYGACKIAAEMAARGERGSIVTLMCDGGERYADTYYDPAWLAAQGLDIEPHRRQVAAFLETGVWAP